MVAIRRIPRYPDDVHTRSRRFGNAAGHAWLVVALALLFAPQAAHGYPTGAREIHLSNPGLPSGTYTVDPDGPCGPIAPFGIYADMTNLGGGWTLLAKSSASMMHTDTLWTSASTSNEGSLVPAAPAAKLRGFSLVPFDQVMVGRGSPAGPLTFAIQGPSAASLQAWFQAGNDVPLNGYTWIYLYVRDVSNTTPQPQDTIRASAGAGGSIAPSGTVLVTCSGSQAFTITPDSCHTISSVLVDGTSVGAVTDFNFDAVTANHTIAAEFSVRSFGITATAGPGGSVTPSGTVAVPCAGSQSFSIVPQPGHEVLQVLVDGVPAGAPASWTFTNVTAGHTLSATFAQVAATIQGIVDVRNDQGRNVLLQFLPSSRDVAGSPTPILQYEVFRRTDPLPGAATARPASTLGTVPGEGALLVGWTFAGAVPAHAETGYEAIAPTLVDSNAVNGLRRTVFFIRAATATPSVYFDSAPDSGYSVDNLSPAMPAAFARTTSGGTTLLNWDESSEADLVGYRLYRGSDPDFVPGPGNLVAALAVTGYADATAGRFTYKLAAVDRNGNASPYAVSEPPAVSVGTTIPAAVWLGPALPNPARIGARIAFGLPLAGHVRLAVYDAAGRVVRVLFDGEGTPGDHAVVWDGRDASGAAVRGSLYFYRLDAGGRTLSRRLVVVR
jgi:hypothetical protein